MKVQLQGQQIRLRISEAELARLQAGETVENLTRLPGSALRQWLRVGEEPQPALLADADGWGCLLPAAALASYVARLPCREGLRLRLPLVEDAEAALEIDLEVDVRDSVRSRGVARRGMQGS